MNNNKKNVTFVHACKVSSVIDSVSLRDRSCGSFRGGVSVPSARARARTRTRTKKGKRKGKREKEKK